MSTQQAESSTYATARLFARHTLNMTEAESVVYAAGFSDRFHRFSHKGQAYGGQGSALDYAYRAGWEDAAHVDEDI